uniref:heat shock protein 70 n=1 Tax=Vacuolaria virescens TaxID=44451 RepID=UPI002114050D|nr:heat shock protein 70 [Vacuolaria virescens]UTE94643.1 heat shock protein 70 [Vacuolaria virescens]
MSKVVGIDLGTTNSVIAVMEGGTPNVIANSEGLRTTPSIVAYTKKQELLVGQIAKRQAVINPTNTFSSVKRFIGSKMDEIKVNVNEFSYKITSEANGNIKINCPVLNKQFSPEEISAQVLRKLATDASKYIGESITKAVITVPAYFNDSQRQATKDAGKIAGLEVLRIINEPTAAAMAYGLDRKAEETILVFDLGGGTFDVSILEVGEGVFEVLSTCGDTQLGGDDFDRAIVHFLLDEFKKDEGIELKKDPQALQRLTEAAEKAKIELSSLTETIINLPFITANETGPKHINKTITRAKFEALCSDLINKCKLPVENAIRDARIDKTKIDEVVLVGGSTRIPAIQQVVKTITNKNPNQTVNPDEVVAVGAAIHGGVLAGEVKNILLLDVTPLSLGVETLGGIMTKVIPRNTTIPTKRSEIFSTAIDNQTNVEISVLQGERQLNKDNKNLGTFRLDGIPLAPRGIPQIEVTFDIDVNGLLSVTAKEKTTGKEQSITIQNASTLDKNEVERMVNEAQEYADADKLKKEQIDLKNQAELLCYQSEKQLKEFEGKISRQKVLEINNLISKIRENMFSENYEKLKVEVENLTKSIAQVTPDISQDEKFSKEKTVNKEENNNIDEFIDVD